MEPVDPFHRQPHFDDAGIATLTMAVALIQAWNRLGVGLQAQLP